MAMLDAFNSTNFDMVSLTNAIDLLPYVPGRVGQMGLFSPRGITTPTAVIEEQAGILRLLPTRRRGEPATVGRIGKRTVRSFAVPHIPHEDTIWADEVAGVRAFGSESAMESVTTLTNRKLLQMKTNFELTWEFHRTGALQGIIYDADGSVIYNLFTEFNVSQSTVDFVLGTAGTDMKAKCIAVARTMEDNLGGIPYNRIHCLCGPTWFDAFVSHATMGTAYARWQDGRFFRETGRKGFEFCDITFEEYRNAVGDRDFIPTGDARFFPVGNPQVFETIYSPANFIETVNTIGIPLYVKKRVLDLDEGVRLHAQSNPLHMCMIPACLIRGYSSN